MFFVPTLGRKVVYTMVLNRFVEEYYLEYSIRKRSHQDGNIFFDLQFNHDYIDLNNHKTYCKGGDVYEGPCGGQHFTLKVNVLLMHV